MRTLNPFFLFLLLCAAALASGCGSSNPSTGEAQQSVSERIDRDSVGRMRLVGFERTNGQRGEVAGIAFYTVEFSAELEILEDCRWLTSGLLQASRDGFKTAPTVNQAEAKGGLWGGFFNMTQNPGTDHKKGQRLTFQGSVFFEESEKGWRASRLEIAKVYASLASHVKQAHREVLVDWLASHPSFRLADAQDCSCGEDFALARNSGNVNDHPYYVAADFNSDGAEDLAVIVIDTSKDPESAIRRSSNGDTTFDQEQGFNAGIVVFNGPVRPGLKQSFMKNGIGSTGGAVLFYRPGTQLMVGNFSSGSSLQPTGDSYSLNN